MAHRWVAPKAEAALIGVVARQASVVRPAVAARSLALMARQVVGRGLGVASWQEGHFQSLHWWRQAQWSSLMRTVGNRQWQHASRARRQTWHRLRCSTSSRSHREDGTFRRRHSTGAWAPGSAVRRARSPGLATTSTTSAFAYDWPRLRGFRQSSRWK